MNQKLQDIVDALDALITDEIERLDVTREKAVVIRALRKRLRVVLDDLETDLEYENDEAEGEEELDA
jgi:Arc/MetJ family transcription regulator